MLNEKFNIEKVELKSTRPLPLALPFQDSSMGPFNKMGLSTITLTDADGFSSEMPVLVRYKNILQNCLIPVLLKGKEQSYQELYFNMYWSIRNEGFRGAAAAVVGQIDLALHNLAAIRKGLSLHHFMGAKRNWARFYGSGCGTNYSLEDLEEEVAFFKAKGADCIKMKVGRQFGCQMDEDIKRVKFVFGLTGNEIKLALDVNQIWSVDQNLEFINRLKLEGIQIEWLEEPVHSAALEEIRELCENTDVAISFGESERCGKLFPSLVRNGVKHLQPIPTHLSSLKEWCDTRDLAKKFNLQFSSGGYPFIAAQLLTTAEDSSYVEYLYPIMSTIEPYFSSYPEIRDGKFFLNNEPGLSVRVNWEKIIKDDLMGFYTEWDVNTRKKKKINISL